jgi:hypothetical protein
VTSTPTRDHTVATTITATPSATKITPANEPITFERKIIEPDAALVELGLACNIEDAIENLRYWFSRKILRTLHDDIVQVNNSFSQVGLEHLSPQSPASFSLFAKAAPVHNGNTIMLTAAGTFQSAARPQTLLDLSQRSPNDPIVQKRMRIERYLSFASLASHRAAVVRRIGEFAEDGLVGAFRWAAGSSILFGGTAAATSSDSSHEDSQILMHLFCAFMDEHLPCEQYYESQPFSAKHFVAFEENPSNRSDSIQIQQVQRQPPYFRLIAEKKIYEVYPGAHNVFHVIVFLVEYLHRHCNGFLGVGNLASPTIDLVSILNTN